MRQMTEGMQQGPTQTAATTPTPPTTAQRVTASSNITQRGEPVDLSSLAIDENASSSVSGHSEQGIDKNEHGAPSSYLTTIHGERETSSASEKGGVGADDDTKSTAASGVTETSNLRLPPAPLTMKEDTPSTADTMLATAKSILHPLRQLAIEACAAEEHVHKEFGSVGLTLKKPATNEEMRAARAVDFDTCASPRTQPSTESPYGSPRVRGACLEYGLDTSGKARKVEPVDPSVHQFSPMSPTVAIAQAISGGAGKILTLKGHVLGHLRQHHGHGQQQQQQQQQHTQHQHENARNAFSAPVSPVAASASGGGGGGRVESVCESGVPPGLLPTARVEGVRRSLDGDVGFGGGGGGGAVPVEFGDDEGESSSGAAEIGELGSQLQGGLRV